LLIKNISFDLFILPLLIAKKRGHPKEKQIQKRGLGAEAEKVY
jgi:hypothetical protein